MGIFTRASKIASSITSTTNTVLFDTNGQQVIDKTAELTKAAFSKVGIETVGEAVGKTLDIGAKVEDTFYKAIRVGARAAGAVIQAASKEEEEIVHASIKKEEEPTDAIIVLGASTSDELKEDK